MRHSGVYCLFNIIVATYVNSSCAQLRLKLISACCYTTTKGSDTCIIHFLGDIYFVFVAF
jgi:hypothetical protein